MSFFLDHSRDQALLALVIEKGSEAAAKKQKVLGRTTLQKIMYFLKVMDVPMGYRFSVHHYGPFCSGILQDTDWLILDEIVEDKSEKPDIYEYSPGQKFDELVDSYSEQLEPHRKAVGVVTDVFASLSANSLEVYSTIDYAFRELRARSGRPPSKEKVIARFKEFKGEKFSQEAVEKAYDRMEEAGLLRG